MKFVNFVDDWRNAGRWLSMRLMAAAAIAQVTWETMPPEALALIPVDWRGRITLGLVLLAMLGRMIKQDVDGAGKRAAR